MFLYSKTSLIMKLISHINSSFLNIETCAGSTQ